MLQPYEEYKPTHYDWLPYVPLHWYQYPIRAITTLSDERNGTRFNSELLSVYREYGVIKKNSRDDNHNVESINLSNYKYVYANNLVMNKMKMWQGSLGISQYEGIVSPAYIVCKINIDLNYRYLHYLLRSPLFKTFYNRISYGVRVGQWDMRYDDFKSLCVYLPLRKEQDQIVRYLDWKLSKINKLIRAKKKQIELLNEQKQVIINKAVTKGLNSKVAMKDSQIDWIGMIPKSWSIIRIKWIFNEVEGRNTDETSTLLTFSRRLGLIAFDEISDKAPSALELSNYKLVKPGQLLENRMQAWSGMFIYVDKYGCVSPDYSVFEKTKDRYVNVKFYEYVFRNPLQVEQFANASKGIGTGFNRLYTPQFGMIYTVYPPKEEQDSIVDYISNLIQSMKKMVENVEYQIELLQNFKTRLVSDVVTGKVDVRGIEIPEYEAVVEESLDEEQDEESSIDEEAEETEEE